MFGMYVKGPDTSGNCLAKDENGGSGLRLDYGKHQSTSCSENFDSFASLVSFCESTTARADLEIFAQFLDRFKYVAIFGNPNINFKGDWITTILEDATTAIKTAGTVDNARKTCALTSALEIEIITSKVGYVDHMQNYVVGVRLVPV